MIKKGKHLNIYNIGTSERVKIITILKNLEEFTSKKVRIIKGPLQIGGTKHRCPNIAKINKLGFKQKVILKDGLKKIYFANYINK